MKVKIKRKIFDGRGHAGRRRDRIGSWECDGGGIRPLVVVVRRDRHNTCRKTSCKQQRHCGENKDSCFHGISDLVSVKVRINIKYHSFLKITNIKGSANIAIVALTGR